jgi:hypothetical protein
MEIHTWLSKVKLAFKEQHLFDQEDKLEVALQHLSKASHTWEERWIIIIIIIIIQFKVITKSYILG